MNNETLLTVLEKRFLNNTHRHPDLTWDEVLLKIHHQPNKLECLRNMELTGGEPDVICINKTTKDYIYVDCVKESPINRRSCCYDQEALDKRKNNKPLNSAVAMATAMGITLLDQQQYKKLQVIEMVDTKTSSWLLTPPEIRNLGGAIFGDYRYQTVFIYHNGADSYYAARGFRGYIQL